MSARRIWSVVIAAISVTAVSISAAAPADAADAQWNGRFTFVTYASQKTGSSMAKLQPEADFTAQFDMVTDCSSGRCVATATNGPPSSNPTVPQPMQYGWDGTRWLSIYTWQWQCLHEDGISTEWAPAKSQVFYTPSSDGSLVGTWRTDILSGQCRGFVAMPVVAYRG